MLKPKKKISKKEIKEDRLVTSYFEATTWYQANKKLVNGILTGLVILVIIVVAYLNNVNSNNRKATAELGMILPYYDQGKYDVAISGNLQENVRGLQAIVDDYSSTKAGGVATFYLANSYFAQGNFDKALKYFLNVDVSDDLVAASALAGAASCYESKGDFVKAATTYENAAYRSSKDINVPDNLFHAGQDYLTAGNKEKATELFKKIKKDFPTSAPAREIERWIAEASA